MVTAAASARGIGDVPRRLDILQIYRGIGATLVVLYHLTWYGGQDPPFLQALMSWIPVTIWDKPLPGFFIFGHSGVDLFFTLSGFVMTWGYARDAGNIRRVWPFLKSRFTRIYPTYWALLLLTVAFFLFRPHLNDSALERGALLRGFFLCGHGPWQVPPAGTLPYELVLYIFFTLLLLAGWTVFSLAAALWCGVIIGQWYGLLNVGNHPIWLSTWVLEFFLGCLAAVFVLRVRPRTSAAWLWLAAALCLMAGIVDSLGVSIDSYHNIRNFAIPYFLLVVAGASYELGGPRQYPRLLMLIGDASYSIYLSHYYLIWELNGRFFHYPVIGAVLGKDGQRLLVFVLVLAIGVACWATIERPLLRFSRRLLRASS
jgi:exopolysaccharide production protein ExoZ